MSQRHTHTVQQTCACMWARVPKSRDNAPRALVSKQARAQILKQRLGNRFGQDISHHEFRPLVLEFDGFVVNIVSQEVMTDVDVSGTMVGSNL